MGEALRAMDKNKDGKIARMSTPGQHRSIASIAIPTGSSPATNCRAGALAEPEPGRSTPIVY